MKGLAGCFTGVFFYGFVVSLVILLNAFFC